MLPCRAPPPPTSPPPLVLLLIFFPLWLPYPQASLCCHFVSASFLHLLHSIPLISLFCSASSLSSLIFSAHLLDSIFSKFVSFLLLFLVTTRPRSFERDVSLKSFKTLFLLPCLPPVLLRPSFPSLLFSPLPLCHSPARFFLLFVSFASLH